MFKSETLVKNFVYILIGLGLSFSQTGVTETIDPSRQKALELLERSCERHTDPNKKLKCIEDAAKITLGQQDVDSCKGTYDEFKKTYDSFIQKCADSQMSSAGKSCEAQTLQCIQCVGEDSDSVVSDCHVDEYDDDWEDDEDGDGVNGWMTALGKANTAMGGVNFGSSQRRRNTLTQDLKNAKFIYPNCPSMAAEDLKGYRDDVKETKKEVSARKEGLEEATKDVMDKQNKLKDDLLAIEEEMEEIQQVSQQKFEELQQIAAEQNQETQNKISELKGLYTEAGNNITALTNQISQVTIEHQKVLSELDAGCRTKAKEQLDQFRAQKQREMMTNTYTAGGFNALIKSSGQSSYKKSVALMRKFYTRCSKEKTFNDQRNIQSSSFDLQLKVIHDQIAALRVQQIRIQQQIDQVIAQIPQAQNRIQNKMTQLNQRMMQALNKLQQKKAQLQMQGQQSMFSDIAKVNRLTSEVQEAEDYLINKQEILNIRKNASKGTNGKEGSHAEAMGLFSTAKNSGLSVLNECGCSPCGAGGLIIGGEDSNPRCQTVKKILGKMGEEGCGGADVRGGPGGTGTVR